MADTTKTKKASEPLKGSEVRSPEYPYAFAKFRRDASLAGCQYHRGNVESKEVLVGLLQYYGGGRNRPPKVAERRLKIMLHKGVIESSDGPATGPIAPEDHPMGGPRDAKLTLTPPVQKAISAAIASGGGAVDPKEVEKIIRAEVSARVEAAVADEVKRAVKAALPTSSNAPTKGK